MSSKVISITSLLIFFLSANLKAQSRKSQKDADKQTIEWRYELEVVGQGVQGTYQVKVWSYSKDVNTATEQAKKNAVHGIIFRGFTGAGRLQGQRPLTNNPNLENEKAEFFKDFFASGGKYLKFVTLANHGAIGAGDAIKVGKEYKVGVVISVNTSELRKDLENAGIIKSLSAGF